MSDKELTKRLTDSEKLMAKLKYITVKLGGKGDDGKVNC